MTLTIDIGPEVRAELARQAAAHGHALEAYAASLLEEATRVPPEPLPRRAGQDSIDASVKVGGLFTDEEVNTLARRAAALDWSHCPAIESISGKVSGAWVFRDTRMPVAAVFENLEDGVTIDELVGLYAGLTREQISAVLDFAARCLDAPAHAG